MGTTISHIHDKIQEHGSLENYLAALEKDIQASKQVDIPYFPDPEEIPRATGSTIRRNIQQV
jgi:hypothetical protein